MIKKKRGLDLKKHKRNSIILLVLILLAGMIIGYALANSDVVGGRPSQKVWISNYPPRTGEKNIDLDAKSSVENNKVLRLPKGATYRIYPIQGKINFYPPARSYSEVDASGYCNTRYSSYSCGYYAYCSDFEYESSHYCNPDCEPSDPISQKAHASVVAKLGSDGELFHIPKEGITLYAREEADLYLGINDCYLNNNQGQYQIYIRWW